MISIKIGEQKPYNFGIKNKNTGLPLSLVGANIIFQLREKEAQIDNFLIEKIISETSNINDCGQITDAANGKFSVFFKTSDTINLNVNRTYYFTIWHVFDGKKEVISSSGAKTEEFKVYPD